MNFIKDKNLALRFKENAVPSPERFNYLAFFIFIAIQRTLPTLVSTRNADPENIRDIIFDISVLILSLIGTYLCYRTNKSGDDKEFIERYISLSCPVFIISLVIFIPIGFAILWMNDHLTGHLLIDSTSLVMPLAAVAIIGFYWRLNYCMKIASH